MKKALILLAHLNEVEAIKTDWSPEFDPFVFTEKEGYLSQPASMTP